MMRSAHFVFAVSMLISGCATRGNVELLESQLRQQEDEIYALRAERDQAKADLRIARQETHALRDQLAEKGKDPLLPEQARSLYRVAGVKVNEWFSGGLDRDDHPGDDLLHVVLTPHDEHGEVVKLPGRLELEVIDFSAPASSRQLGVWEFDAEEVSERWQSGLTSGFQFRLPLERPPGSNYLVVNARFGTTDGRQFQTTADLRVTPPEIQYAGPRDPATDGPTVQTSVKPISPQVPRIGIVSPGTSADRKPALPSLKHSPGDAPPEELFPAKMPSDETSASSTSRPPTPATPSASPVSEWGWKSLDSFHEKTPPQTTASRSPDDFQPVSKVPSPAPKETQNLELPRVQNTEECQWSHLSSSDDGERKPF